MIETVDCVHTATPEPKEPDWELAKLLYTQGVAQADILPRANVPAWALRKRITRGKWTVLRANVSTAIETLVSKPIQRKDIEDASNQVKEALAGRFKAHASVIAGMSTPKSLKGIRTEHEALAPLVQNGKVLFNWGESTHSTTFNFALLDSTRDVETPVETPAIDVKSEPVETKPLTPDPAPPNPPV